MVSKGIVYLISSYSLSLIAFKFKNDNAFADAIFFYMNTNNATYYSKIVFAKRPITVILVLYIKG